MLHPSTQQLIRKLCELTDAGHIAWQEGERQSSRFDSEGYVVEVEAEPPTLRLLRGDGRELERADAADLAATPWPDGAGTFATHVAAMAGKAHRVARGAEAAIASILSSLSTPSKTFAEPAPAPQPAVASTPPPPHAAPPPEPNRAPPQEIVRAEPPRSAPAAAAPIAPSSAALPKPAFGAVESFAKTPEPEPAPAMPPPLVSAARAAPAPAAAHPAFLIKGFSARSVQTPESGMVASVAAQPARPPKKEPELPPAVSVYKPWN